MERIDIRLHVSSYPAVFSLNNLRTAIYMQSCQPNLSHINSQDMTNAVLCRSRSFQRSPYTFDLRPEASIHTKPTHQNLTNYRSYNVSLHTTTQRAPRPHQIADIHVHLPHTALPVRRTKSITAYMLRKPLQILASSRAHTNIPPLSAFEHT
jgi:hypothetical protein